MIEMTLRVNELMSRTKVRHHSAPMPTRIETIAPISGSPAARRPLKTITSRTSATGRLTDSPRTRSFSTSPVMESEISVADTACASAPASWARSASRQASRAVSATRSLAVCEARSSSPSSSSTSSTKPSPSADSSARACWEVGSGIVKASVTDATPSRPASSPRTAEAAAAALAGSPATSTPLTTTVMLSPPSPSVRVIEYTTWESVSGVVASALASLSKRPPAPRPWNASPVMTVRSSAQTARTTTGCRDTARPMRVNMRAPCVSFAKSFAMHYGSGRRPDRGRLGRAGEPLPGSSGHLVFGGPARCGGVRQDGPVGTRRRRGARKPGSPRVPGRHRSDRATARVPAVGSSGNPCPGRHLADEDQTHPCRGEFRAPGRHGGAGGGSPRRESNPRPFAYKANALAAELRRRCRALGPGVLVRRRRQRGRRTSRTIVPSRGRGRPVDAGRMLSRGRRRRRGRPGSCRAARPARRPRRRPIRPA